MKGCPGRGYLGVAESTDGKVVACRLHVTPGTVCKTRGRRIPPGGVAHRSLMPNKLALRALADQRVHRDALVSPGAKHTALTNVFTGRPARAIGLRRVVGVVGDIRHVGPEAEWRTQAFVPIAQSPVIGATLVVRTTRGAQDVWTGIRRAIAAEFSGLPLRVDEGTLEGYYGELVAERRFNMLLLTLFGLLGLVIAVVGIYGVMAYVVTHRTKEIGIRMALGAAPAAILRSVLGGALVCVAIGLAIGLLGAWILAGAIGGFLFEIRPHDPTVYAGVVVVLGLAGLTAAALPARRAASADPLIALRME